MRRRFSGVVAALALGAVVLSACSQAALLTISATFDDVIDLVTQASVRAGDIPIGSITAIELTDDLRAKVTMEIRGDTGLPAEVEALLIQTSLLGERYIDLRPIGTGGALTDGAEIANTRVVNDFEDLVFTGVDLFGTLVSDSVAAAVQTGAQALGGRGSILGQFITDLEIFLGSYDENKGDVLRLIDGLDTLTAGLAGAAETNAESLAVLARAAKVFEEEDERLLDALDDLRRLAIVGERVMRDNRTETDNAIRRIRIILEQVLRIDGALQDVLTWLPRHNVHVPSGAVNELTQVWNDFIVCGTHDDPSDPALTCGTEFASVDPGPPAFVDDENNPCDEQHAAECF